MKNRLYLIVPSNLKNKEDVLRFCKSVDVTSDITIFFINQSMDKSLEDIYKFDICTVKEYKTGGVVPLSTARNIALNDMYTNKMLEIDNALVMFVDDDAWFPEETIKQLLSENIGAYCLRTIDPVCNKSFNGLSHTSGEVKGWHLIHDICSICLVVPYKNLLNAKIYFNEKLGLGNTISQGEESLFIYKLHSNGARIYYKEYYIYHPYKLSNNINNYYSLSYFWAWGVTNVSRIFVWPCIKYLAKYTIALGLTYRSNRYPQIFKAVWRGAFDGIRNTEKILLK